MNKNSYISGNMREEMKKKVLEKWKQKAMEWHISKGGSVKIPEKAKEFIPEDKSIEVEMAFIKELKKIIVDSNLDRKSILLNVLANQERNLEKGIEPGKLPDVIKNIARKDEISSDVIRIAKEYNISGVNLCYLWGLENE